MSSETPDRLHALDAVRGFALILGVVFHASLSFFPGPPIWPIADRDPALPLAVLSFVLHSFRLTTFFLIAGFFAHMSFHRRGLGGFVVDRLKRIALPLVVGWPIVIAATVAVLIWASMGAHGGVVPTNAPPPPTFGVRSFPLTHLWFLYDLLLLYAATLAMRGLVVALDWKGGLRRGLDRVVAWLVGHSAPVLLALPLVAAFNLQPAWSAWFGVATPDMTLIPNLPAALAFGSAFGLGWLVHRQPALLGVWRRRWGLNLVLAMAFTSACLALVGPTPTLAPIADPARRLVYALCYTLSIWTWSFGVIGFALRFLAGFSPVRRYIADSSFWVYLVHLPLVMALQVVAAPSPLPWLVKFPALLAASLFLAVGSYQLLVRHSFIGWVLNGPRPRNPNARRAAGEVVAEGSTKAP